MLKTLEDNVRMIEKLANMNEVMPEASSIQSHYLRPQQKNFIFLFLTGGMNSQVTEFKEQFDFTKNETLKIEKIVSSCFSNPNRKNLAWTDLPFWSGQETAAQLVQRIKNDLPKSMRRFDEAEIKLHDTDVLWVNSSNGQPVDKSDYINAIKTCKWYGPYQGQGGQPCFYSFNNDRSNKYWLKLLVDFSEKKVTLSYRKSNSDISTARAFSNN